MKNLFFLYLAFTLLLAACASAGDVSGTSELPVNTSEGSYPTDEALPPTEPAENYAPRPGDAALSRGPAYLELTELLTLESYPLQFMLHVKGTLPTPCHNPRVAVNPPDAENKVMVEIYSVAEPTKLCAQMLSPFEITIPLGSFPPGTYTLWINGEKVTEFQSNGNE